MKKYLRVAIVSATGTGAKRTIPALANSPVVTVSAIHGRDSTILKHLAERYSIDNVYTDLSKMIYERLFDFAIVCSPPFLHEEQASQLLAEGIPCLIEKPVDLSASKVEKLLTLSKRTQTKVCVAHHLRYTPIFNKIKTILKRGDLGKIHNASMEWSFRLNRLGKNAKWKLNPVLNGPTCLTDAGVHCLDLAVALFGCGKLQAVIPEIEGEKKTIEELIMISSHGNVLVSTTCSRLYGPFSNNLRISGSDGEIFVPEFFGENPASRGTLYLNKKTETINAPVINPYRLEVEDFASTLSGEGLNLATTLEEALDVALLLDDVKEKMNHPLVI